MTVSRGDIVLVDYPFSDRTGSKVRPALVVQSDALNHRINDTILAAISRSQHRASANQLLTEIATPEGVQSGLKQDSMIQCENLLTYDRGLILAKIGSLPIRPCNESTSVLRQPSTFHNGAAAAVS
jgi:mRNA interferase MazF